MAVLTEPVANTNVFSDKTQELAPQGTHAATLVEVKDEFGVTIKDWDNPGATKKVDRTTFLFGLRDAAGKAFYVATRAMTISGNAKSALMGFLTAMLGYTPPYGVDYCTYKGHKCLVTVNHVKTKDGTRSYAGITTVCPMPSNMAVPAPAPAAPATAVAAVKPAAPVAPAAPAPSVESADEIPF